jgi:hypothetical protein
VRGTRGSRSENPSSGVRGILPLNDGLALCDQSIVRYQCIQSIEGFRKSLMLDFGLPIFMTIRLDFYSHATLFDVRNTFLVHATLVQLFRKYPQPFKSATGPLASSPNSPGTVHISLVPFKASRRRSAGLCVQFLLQCSDCLPL